MREIRVNIRFSVFVVDDLSARNTKHRFFWCLLIYFGHNKLMSKPALLATILESIH